MPKAPSLGLKSKGLTLRKRGLNVPVKRQAAHNIIDKIKTKKQEYKWKKRILNAPL